MLTPGHSKRGDFGSPSVRPTTRTSAAPAAPPVPAAPPAFDVPPVFAAAPPPAFGRFERPPAPDRPEPPVPVAPPALRFPPAELVPPLPETKGEPSAVKPEPASRAGSPLDD